MKFTKAFADARKAGQETFRWNGKLYNTKLAKTTPENTTAVKQLQTILKNEGLYKGRIDGIFGPLSETAFNSYNKPISISNLPSWIVGGKGKETSTPVVTPPPKKTPTSFSTPPKVTPTPTSTTTEKPKTVKKNNNSDTQWKYYPKGTWGLGDMDGLDVDGKSYRLVGPTTFNRTGYDAAESRFYVKEDDQVYAQRGAKEALTKIQEELKDAEIRVNFPGYLAKGRETAEMQFKRPGDDRWHAMDSTIVARGQGVWSNYDNQGNYNPWTSWRQKEILNMPTTEGYKYPQTPYEFRSNPYKYGGPFKYPDGGPLKDQPPAPVLDVSRWQLGKEMYDAMPQWKKDAEARAPENVGYMSLNPKNWNLNDYSKYSSFNSAFRNARSRGEKEFMYKDKRYNTNLIPKEDSDNYNDSKAFLDDYYRTQNFKTEIDTFQMANDFQMEKYGITQNNLNIDSVGIEEYINRRKEIREKGPDFLKYMEKHRNTPELENLHSKDYYFSITNQKPKDMTSEGHVNRAKKNIYLTTQNHGSDVNTTYVHELSHKSDDIGNVYVATRYPPINFDNFSKKGYPRHSSGVPMSRDFFQYVINDSELEARKMSALYFLKKNNRGYKSGEVTWDDLAFLVDSDNVPFDIKQLTEVYKHQLDDLLKYLNNDFNYGDPQQPQMTKEIKPIEKSKFQYGGVYNPYTTKRNFRGPDQMKLPEHNLGGLLGSLGKSMFGTAANATSTIGTLAGATGLIQGNPNKANVALGTLQGAAKGFGAGASLGSIIPGFGTLIGGGVGALVGGIKSFIGGQKLKKQMEEDAVLAEQQRVDNMPDTVNQFGTFKFGGNMFSPDLLKGASIQYNGPSHANGGTMVNSVGLPTTDPSKAVGEVEKKERMFTMPGGTKYIFSDHLTF